MISGAVLAGGLSTRMGSDKALLRFKGTPLAARMARTLQRGGGEDVHIVGSQDTLGSLGWPLIQDTADTFHPLLGVAAALRSASTPLVLIAPCDLINLMPEHIERLLATGAPCVASFAGNIHPLLAILPVTLADHAQQLAEAGSPAMRLTARLEQFSLPELSLIDANTPEDLTR